MPRLPGCCPTSEAALVLVYLGSKRFEYGRPSGGGKEPRENLWMTFTTPGSWTLHMVLLNANILLVGLHRWMGNLSNDPKLHLRSGDGCRPSVEKNFQHGGRHGANVSRPSGELAL